jgi:hypothetical protein
MLVCTITAEAKDVYFAYYRAVINEIPFKVHHSVYCPTRIEVDYDAKTLVIKTETRGTASYTFSDIYVDTKSKVILFIDYTKDNVIGDTIGGIVFADTDYSEFNSLVIYRKNNTAIVYKHRRY